ncbi:signal recognition particle receptor subunit beta [Cryptococcus wingfieldii CBS 7118]|uniref:Signal recognition particle receptor subunit beta n=1 Tax=Cryptococcus wingfieldii CBS 7118 TaxID=1295528 RepID=A0A1E3IKQ7_9TREE|nr:signal recognition particle receptor subunit beta [Cryptococcus wingfieldii CBS 7118]ODN89184.1 signal recognition particle receptor subunit beta [Cryptococcus wingfieldii CBS 7118]
MVQVNSPTDHGPIPPTAPGQVQPEVAPLSALLAHPLLQDPKFVAAAGGLALIVLLFAILRPGKKGARRNGPATVLLVGPADGGKTSLFTKLAFNTHLPTHTSIISSSSTFSLSSPFSDDGQSKQVRLVDLPGHPRLRDEVKKYEAEAAAVVFVVDIQGVIRNGPGVAEQLPPILASLASLSTHLPPSAPPPKLLILAHKSDLLIRPAPTTSLSPPDIPETSLKTGTDRLKSILTREMDRLKSTRASTGGRIEGMSKVAGSSTGFFARIFGSGGGGGGAEGEGEEDDESLVWGGKGPFRWEDVEGVEVEWAASGLGVRKEGDVSEGNGLDELKAFLWDI